MLTKKVKFKNVMVVFVVIMVIVFSYGCSMTPMGKSNDEIIQKYQSNVKLDPASIRDRVGIYYPEIKRGSTLPSVVDLSDNMPPVKSQGGQGSCTSWAVGYAAMTYLEKMENNNKDLNLPINQFSPAFFYNQIHEGFVAQILDMAVEKGCIQWPYLPYNQNDSSSQPSITALTQALKFRASSWQYLDKSIESLKTVLASGKVVIFVTASYHDLYALSKDNPIFDTTDGNKYGYHALCMVGYDDNKHAFKFINSWGDDWGIDGYGWYSYDFIGTPVFADAYLLFDRPNKSVANPKIIHYYSSGSEALIHYAKNNGLWTNVPGIYMAKESDNWFVTAIDNTNDFTFCFYNSGWDSNNGQNYHTNLQEVWVKNGQVYNNNPDITEIIVNFFDKDTNEPIIHKTVSLTNLSTDEYQSKWSAETGTIRFENVENANYKLSSTSYSEYLFDGYKQEYFSTFTINNSDHFENIYMIHCIGGAGIYFNIEDEYYSYNPLIGSTADLYKDGDFFRTIDIGKMSNSTAHSSLNQLPFGEYRVVLDSTINSINYTGELSFTITEDDHYFSGDMNVTKNISDHKIIHYYNNNFSDSYIHYQNDNGEWTLSPGIKMNKEAYNWNSMTINDRDSITFCFNNGNGNWDSNDGNNYTTNITECWVKNGMIYTKLPVDNDNTTFNATINHLSSNYTVKIYGSFNNSNWQTPITMNKVDSNKWSISTHINEAQFEYKYVAEDENGNKIWESYSGNRNGQYAATFNETVYF